MGLQGQLDDIFRQPGDPAGASRRKTLGAKPKLWDAWIKPGDGEKDSVHELAEMKVRRIARSSLLFYNTDFHCCDS